MKKRIVTIVAALALGAVLVLSGCATTPQTGTERGETTSQSMETVEEDIRLVITNIDVTGETLASLIRPDQPELEKAFDEYSAAVDALAASSEVYIEHSDEMGALGRDYFAEWRVEGAEYTDPQIRALSEQRRSELSAVYADIATKSVGVQGSLDSHLATLEEIRTYFSTDLTPRGVEVMTPVAQSAIEDGEELTTSLEDVFDSISAVRDELASGDVPDDVPDDAQDDAR